MLQVTGVTPGSYVVNTGPAGGEIYATYPNPKPRFAMHSEVEELRARVKEIEALVSTIMHHPLMPWGQEVMHDFEDEKSHGVEK